METLKIKNPDVAVKKMIDEWDIVRCSICGEKASKTQRLADNRDKVLVGGVWLVR